MVLGLRLSFFLLSLCFTEAGAALAAAAAAGGSTAGAGRGGCPFRLLAGFLGPLAGLVTSAAKRLELMVMVGVVAGKKNWPRSPMGEQRALPSEQSPCQ